MNAQELTALLIDEYMNLQRILASNDRDIEINYQLKEVKSRLKSMGIVTTDLDLEKQ